VPDEVVVAMLLDLPVVSGRGRKGEHARQAGYYPSWYLS